MGISGLELTYSDSKGMSMSSQSAMEMGKGTPLLPSYQ